MSPKIKALNLTLISLTIILLLFFVVKSIKISPFSPATTSLPSIQSPLEWSASDYPTKTDWNTASSYCAGLSNNLGQYPYVAWRLPTIDELVTAHNTTSTPILKNWFYWSSTEVSSTSSTSSLSYDLDMTTNISSHPTIFNKNLPDDYARCVRSITITAPDAPTDVSATAGDSQALISFTAPLSNGGSAVTYYTVTSSPGNIIATTSSNSATVVGLTNGISYNFTVTASNVVGMSTNSLVSNTIIPVMKLAKGTRSIPTADLYCSGILNTYTTPSPTFAGGDGSSGNPYQISNWSELNNMRDNLYAYYILTTNLSSTTPGYSGIGNNWTPIGGCGDPFQGDFNGNNKTISDLVTTIYSNVGVNNFKNKLSGIAENIIEIFIPNKAIAAKGGAGGGGGGPQYTACGASVIHSGAHIMGVTSGLFGYLSGNVHNLGLINITVNQGAVDNVGAIAGVLWSGNISNSYATGNVTGDMGAGGLVSDMGGDSTITNSYSAVRVISYFGCGGIAATLESGTSTSTYWDTQVSTQSTSAVGVGETTSQMFDSSTYTGWDTGIWNILDGSYPTLN